jgi:hypothetical protein
MRPPLYLIKASLFIAIIACFIAVTDKLVSSNQLSTPIQQKSPKQSSISIDGSKDPAAIPDHVAYAILFRILSNRETAAAQKASLAYLAHINSDKSMCSDRSNGLSDNDKSILLDAANNFRSQVKLLDEQARAVKLNHPNLNIKAISLLNDLQSKKDAIVTETIKSISTKLSAAGKEVVYVHLQKHIKPNIKIYNSAKKEPSKLTDAAP